MQSVIRDNLVNRMMNTINLVITNIAFFPGRSCMTQLFITLERCTELPDGGDSVYVIYLDFIQAFDTVPCWRLIKKLEAYGIKGGLLTWIDNFLSGRWYWWIASSILEQESSMAYHKAAYLDQFCSSYMQMTPSSSGV